MHADKPSSSSSVHTIWYDNRATTDATLMCLSVLHSLLNKIPRPLELLQLGEHFTLNPEGTIHHFPTENRGLWFGGACWRSRSHEGNRITSPATRRCSSKVLKLDTSGKWQTGVIKRWSPGGAQVTFKMWNKTSRWERAPILEKKC